MPFLIAIALTCAALSATFADTIGALEARRLRGVHMQRNLVLAHRQDAARVQYLGAIAGDFLRFIVMQGAQQPRRRHGARIGAEHAGHVGPDLEARRVQFGREIRARSVRPAAAQQHGFAGLVRGNESLGDHHLLERPPARLQRRVRREIAGGRQADWPCGWRRAGHRRAAPRRASAQTRVDALGVQECRSQGSRQKFAH